MVYTPHHRVYMVYTPLRVYMVYSLHVIPEP
jgi:hypothetical protein